MPQEGQSFFDELKDETTQAKEPVVVPTDDEEVSDSKDKEQEKDPRDIALERKSTALAEERRKRKKLEEELKQFQSKKANKKPDEEEEEDLEPEDVAPSAPVNEESLIQKIEERRKASAYSENTGKEILTLAKGAGKSKQWAQKIQETVNSLPQNLRSGDAATDVSTAIRFAESAGGNNSFNMSSSGSSVDLPFGPGTSLGGDLSQGAREFIKNEMHLDDKTVDAFLSTPTHRLENGNLSFKLIK